MDNFTGDSNDNIQDSLLNSDHSLVNISDLQPDIGFTSNQYSAPGDNVLDVLNFSDPLKYAHTIKFPSFEMNNIHFVKPHFVDGYIKTDGTIVNGYFRDGDGNSFTNLQEEQVGGYFRSNPDGNLFNNLK